jgi:hypothetical protein
MTDRELLELAAKAAGYDETKICIDEWFWVLNETDDWTPWNPLTDDGDALRLAVKLNIVVWEFNQYDRAMAEVRYGEARGEYWEFAGEDKYSSTRRAITRAAAEIGKEMK